MADIDMDKVRAAAERFQNHRTCVRGSLGTSVHESPYWCGAESAWDACQQEDDECLLSAFACHILESGDVLVPRADVLFAAGVLDNPGDWLELDADRYEKLLTTARRLRALGGTP